MTMSRAIYCVMLSVLWFIQAASAQEPISAQDPNRPQSEATTRTTPGVEVMGRVAAQAMASHKASDPPLCAVVVLPGPADSFTIRLGVFNVSAHSLDTLILDSFRALGGQALLHQSVFDTIAPPSGTLTVHYPPDEAGNGPGGRAFTGFTHFKSPRFRPDSDTH